MSQPQPYVNGDGSKSWLFGLPPYWRAVLNVGVILLVCWWYSADRHQAFDMAREDRQLFREELKEQRKALEKVSRAVEDLARELRASRKAQSVERRK